MINHVRADVKHKSYKILCVLRVFPVFFIAVPFFVVVLCRRKG